MQPATRCRRVTRLTAAPSSAPRLPQVAQRRWTLGVRHPPHSENEPENAAAERSMAAQISPRSPTNRRGWSAGRRRCVSPLWATRSARLHPISARRVRAMANPARAGRRVAALVGAWTLAVLSLAAEAAAGKIERPTFILEVPEPWTENAGMATDRSAELVRQGDASAACLILVNMENRPATESARAEFERFLASEDWPATFVPFWVGAQETVLETGRRRKGDSELVVVVSEKKGDRLLLLGPRARPPPYHPLQDRRRERRGAQGGICRHHRCARMKP